MASSHSIDIFKEIEGAILSGKFKPRERLTEMGLMAIFGVGRTGHPGNTKETRGQGAGHYYSVPGGRCHGLN